jgi:hypothetical protein
MAEPINVSRRPFDEHLEKCSRCRDEPFNLCVIGAHLLRTTAMALAMGMDLPRRASGPKTEGRDG